ncbi:FAD-binding protein, partial [Kineococcus sp. T13]|uniref:NAD(P)/FAD-dependent oxidoreductase n=1 Tax=Kineococcus vitellinus TaxID=2696565 RepID=UPI0014133EA0
CTSRPAAAAGREVHLVEADRLPPGPLPRDGVPQGRQAHVLLHAGLLAAQDLLPGLREDLLAAGAVPVHTGLLPWRGEHGWSPVGGHGHEVLSTTRPLLEHVVRTRVTALPGVRVHEGTPVTDLERGRDGWSVRTAGGGELAGEVVVEASGRSSRLPQRLARLGLPPAAVSRVDARTGYATRRYRGDGGGTALVLLATPSSPRGALVLPVEDGDWLVAAVGAGQDRPPRAAAGFEEFLRSLGEPALAEQLRRWVPRGEVAVHRQTADVRRAYERVPGWPAGLLVLGDALCAFNPVYGQGLAVAARQAVLLRQALGAGRLDARATRRWQRRLARVTDVPWAIATGEDLRLPTTEGRPGPAQRALSRWARAVDRLAAHGDARAARTLGRTYHLVGSPVELLHPALVLAALRAAARGPGAANPRPAALVRSAAGRSGAGRP